MWNNIVNNGANNISDFTAKKNDISHLVILTIHFIRRCSIGNAITAGFGGGYAHDIIVILLLNTMEI